MHYNQKLVLYEFYRSTSHTKYNLDMVTYSSGPGYGDTAGSHIQPEGVAGLLVLEGGLGKQLLDLVQIKGTQGRGGYARTGKGEG